LKETFSPYSKLFIGLKICVLPPLLLLSESLCADSFSGDTLSAVSPITQGGVIFLVEAVALWITKFLNDRAKNKQILAIKSQIDELNSLVSDGLNTEAEREANKHVKKLNSELVELTATRF
jgi:hypothetical protein